MLSVPFGMSVPLGADQRPTAPSASELPAALTCGSVEKACQISGPNGGSYHVVAPDGWDGTSPLGALIFFHGYNASGKSFYGSKPLHRLINNRNEFLILPNGLQKSWSFTGSPTQDRDELVFVRKLVDDLSDRLPIQSTELWTAGFSMGGSMVWELACRSRVPFRAHVAISGAFWRPLPGECRNAGAPVLHIHGRRDRIVPMNGRPIGAHWHQGDVTRSMQILERSHECSGQPRKPATQRGPYTCRAWTKCKNDRMLQLCEFDGGHGLPRKWTELANRFLGNLPD